MSDGHFIENEPIQIPSEVKYDKSKLLKQAADLFHKWGMWAILFIAIGVYGGVTVSKGYYNSKMDECIKLQGLVYKDKIYNINPKL